MFFIVMYLFYYNYVPCAFFNILMLLVILIDIYIYIVQCIDLLVNKDLSLCLLLVFSEYSSDAKMPTYLPFSPNVANYASRRTALFMATFGSCDVMPCYQISSTVLTPVADHR